MRRLTALCIVSLAFFAAAFGASAQQCRPTPGLFITTGNFSSAATFTAAPYTLSRSATAISVSQGGTPIYSHATPTGFNSSYRFYGTTNRYLLIQDARSTATDVEYRLKVVNLAASPTPAQFSLLSGTFFASGTPQLHAQPSAGNGQAIFSFVGAGGEVRNLTIHCSENGMPMCGTPPFTPSMQVIGEATATTVRIKEGGAIRAECLLPAPAITVSPSSLNFGTVTEGIAGPSRTVTVTNSGSLPLTYSTSMSEPLFSNTPTGGTVAAGSSATVTVNFNPPTGTAPGTKSGQLTFTHNDASRGPQVVNLSGVVASAQPTISVTTTSIAFGDVIEGTTQSRTFSVQNTGTASLTFSIASSNSMFQISPTSGSIAPGGNRVITATVAPPLGASPGVQSGSASVTHNDPSATPRLVALSANIQPAIPRACYTPIPVSFGSVNAGTIATRTFTVTNCGTAQLQIQSASLVSSASVWSFSPAVPPSIPLAVGASRTFSISLSPPATLATDTTYTAQLQVTTNDGFTAQPVIVDISGTGHVPVADIDIPAAYWDIDFGETQVGFQFSRPLLIRNIGDRALTLEVVRVDPSDPEAAEFILETDSTTFTIPAGSERTFQQTFTPATAGAKEVVIRVQNTNDPTFTQQEVRLHGVGTPPVPIDVALVLDQSGSMGETAGEVTKITALRSAASLFVELLRPNTDYIGITTYNELSENIVPLGAVASAKPQALAAIQAITPSGATGIGGAILNASTQFQLSPPVTAPDPAHRRVMVVLTDGKENRSPTIRQALDGYNSTPGVFTTYPNLMTYSVGLGLEANISADRLQELTSRGTGGFYFVTGNLEGANRFNLESFYFKVFSDAIGNAMVVDPTYLLEHTRSLEIPVPVIADDKQLIVMFVGEFPEASYNLELLDPKGRQSFGTAVTSPMPAQVARRENWAVMRVALPRPSISMEHSGVWKLRVRLSSSAAAALVDKKKAKDRGPSYSRVTVSASVSSDYKLLLKLPERIALGQAIPIRVFMTRAGWPAPGAKVTAIVTDPSGSVTSVQLFDDGKHDDGASADGVFAGVYAGTKQKGAYPVSILADGKSQRGERTRREGFATQFVGEPAPDPTAERCLTCTTTRVWIGLTAAILALLVALAIALMLLYRRRCTPIRDGDTLS